jgi:hypothetical protein
MPSCADLDEEPDVFLLLGCLVFFGVLAVALAVGCIGGVYGFLKLVGVA